MTTTREQRAYAKFIAKSEAGAREIPDDKLADARATLVRQIEKGTNDANVTEARRIHLEVLDAEIARRTSA